MPTAFVAGATGYTGRAVVRASARRGAGTLAHVRPDSARLADWTARFRAMGAEVDITPWEPAALTATLRALAPAEVYALLGTTRHRAQGEGLQATEAYERVDYGLTVMLLEAVVATGLRPRFVYLSAAGADRGSGGAYMQARVRAEAAIRASGLSWTIARPSWITGADRDESRPGERVGAAVTDALMAVAGVLGARRLRARYASTTNEALAAALVRLAADPAAQDRVFESEALR